ncbi:hypothetical protein N7509_000822 [Penicillium cosmopolitanum]|uniref:Amino acid permease/ SLC12A domain-containing protein n=1 Tax=Penicillium cosmopolitanum TaxID=1131564 RepID=A0A9W9WB78_9EURO|nr:uncharacterized protein N7509_000822 [Penicillium cosmopolitanum]KAJ5414195.1 hypothetical protein N7509_000822 [Penicillium cosmopolitanum]
MEEGGTTRKRHTNATAEADASLERMGIKSDLERNSFSSMSMLGMAFAIVNSWCAIGTTVNASLPSGGPSSAVWGILIAGIFNLCCGVSLAEFLSAYPTAGGQYHWAAVASWKSTRRAVSYITGWINLAAWVCLAAANCLLVSGIIMSYAELVNPTFEPKPWQRFLLYIAIGAIAFSYNLFANRFLSHLNKYNMFFTLAGFIISLIVILACAAPDFQSAKFVFGGFINESGWPDGWAWQLGLLQGAFSVTAYDSTIHMIEEMPNPTTQGPKLMISAIVMAVITGFGYIAAVLAVMTDIPSAISASEPLLEIYYQATSSKAGSICLMMFPLLSFVLCAIDDMATAARMAYALARDGGMPFNRHFERVSPKFGLPVAGLVWCFGWVIVLGLIFLGSDNAFNAIISAAVVSFTITYAIPPGINMLRGRRMLPENRSFKLPNTIGYICNAADVAWALLTTVLFVWPTSNPTTPSNMNYCIAAFGVILVIAASNWVLSARKTYRPPKLELVHGHNIDGLVADEIIHEIGLDQKGENNSEKTE